MADMLFLDNDNTYVASVANYNQDTRPTSVCVDVTESNLILDMSYIAVDGSNNHLDGAVIVTEALALGTRYKLLGLNFGHGDHNVSVHLVFSSGDPIDLSEDFNVNMGVPAGELKASDGSGFASIQASYDPDTRPVEIAVDVIEQDLDTANSYITLDSTNHFFDSAAISSEALALGTRYKLSGLVMPHGDHAVSAHLEDDHGLIADINEETFNVRLGPPIYNVLVSVDGSNFYSPVGPYNATNIPTAICVDVQDSHILEDTSYFKINGDSNIYLDNAVVTKETLATGTRYKITGLSFGIGDHSIFAHVANEFSFSTDQTTLFSVVIAAPVGTLLVSTNGTDFAAPAGPYNATTRPAHICVDVISDCLNLGSSSLTVDGGSVIDLDSAAITVESLALGTRYKLSGLTFAEGSHTIAFNLVDDYSQTGSDSNSFDVDLLAPLGVIVISSDGGATWEQLSLVTTPLNQEVLVGVEMDHETYNALDITEGMGHNGASWLKIDGLSQNLGDTGMSHAANAGLTLHWFWNPTPIAAEGTHDIIVYLQDLANNNATFTDSLEIDVRPEGIIKISVDGGAIWINPVAGDRYSTSEIQIAVDTLATDLNLTNCKFTINGTDTVFTGSPDDLGGGVFRYICTATITLDGIYSIAATLEDNDGDINSTAIGSTVKIDTASPVGHLQISIDGGDWNSLTVFEKFAGSSTVDLRFAVPTSVTDLAVDTSSFSVLNPGESIANQQLFNGLIHTSEPSFNYYQWTIQLSATGLYSVLVVLKDDLGNSSSPYNYNFSMGAPSFKIGTNWGGASNDILVSHTNDDGTNNNGTGMIMFGNSQHNYMAVRIQNDTTAGQGDCMYRLFMVPACLFTATTNWKLVNNGTAPTVTDIAPGTDKVSTGNIDFDEDHPEFPDGTIWNDYSNGDILHCCVCAVIHSSNDPLLLPDSGGVLQPIADVAFTSVVQFKDQVMDVISKYNNGTGTGYWNAVRNNPKIANRNLSVKNVTS